MLGVSRLDGKEDEIRHFLNLGVSKSLIAKITGVSRSTLYNLISTRVFKPSCALSVAAEPRMVRLRASAYSGSTLVA